MILLHDQHAAVDALIEQGAVQPKTGKRPATHLIIVTEMGNPQRS